jgi:uncharacterized protein (DUF427 family)
MKAVWNGEIIAQSDDTVIIEGNHYFPPGSVNMDLLQDSATHTICPWKGTASYYDIVVGGEVNPDAAWYYPEVSELAKAIKGYVAFWHGVEVVK